MDNSWIDFKAVKAAVSIQMALDHYQINWLQKETGDLVGKCPIHKGDGKRAFRVSVSKNAFNCFSCKVHGNVIDFVAAMENCSVREAALKLKDWFSLTMSESGTVEASVQKKQTARLEQVGERAGENKALAFELKGVDPTHPYLANRGISQEIAERFGVGFFPGKGSMSGRIVFPIHNEKAELVAYAGRCIDDSEPKYKFPAGFHKAQVLFNFHRVLKAVGADRPIVLVEGFFDCMNVEAAGFPAVALMGCSLSAAQEQLLVSDFDRVIVMLDGDEAGRKAAGEISNRLVPRMFVRMVDVGKDKQPDQLSSELLRQLLDFAPLPSVGR